MFHMRIPFYAIALSVAGIVISVTFLGLYINPYETEDLPEIGSSSTTPRANNKSTESKTSFPEESSKQPGKIETRIPGSPTPIPDNLSLPVDPDDIVTAISNQGFISPFGVVRKSLDRPEYGHSGIDIPSPTDSLIMAVADGVILGNELANDGRPGYNVKLLLSEGVREGEGWIFIYEHIELQPGITLGTEVQKGQPIARNSLIRSNNHLQLSYFFNDYKFSRNHTCWVDQLDPVSQITLLSKFNEIIRVHANFITGWSSADDEGRLPLRELLNEERFPEGAQLCYPPGTDVRV
ncbi:MAG: peptidoglycan DD-metalloendopeptidase family protein [Nitrososphaerales archaeon]